MTEVDTRTNQYEVISWNAPSQLNNSARILYDVEIRDLNKSITWFKSKNKRRPRITLEISRFNMSHEYEMTIWPKNDAGKGKPERYYLFKSKPHSADYQDGAESCIGDQKIFTYITIAIIIGSIVNTLSIS